MAELKESIGGVLSFDAKKLPLPAAMKVGDPPLKVLRMSQNALGMHAHEFNELVVVLKGRGLHRSGAEEYQICAGDVFFVKPGVYHSYSDTDGLVIVNILYYPAKLGLPLAWLQGEPGYKALFELEPESRRKSGFKGRLALSLDSLSSVEMMILEMEGELALGSSSGIFMAASVLMRLLGTLSRIYARGASPAAAHLVRIGRALSFVETSYRKKISLDELAKISRMSKSSLIREFKRLTGTSPVDYLLRVRLGKAAELLTSGDASIGEAALRCGFADGNYFARQFRRFTGLSPRAYRKLAGGEATSAAAKLRPFITRPMESKPVPGEMPQ